MAGRAQVLTGIWEHVSMAQGTAGKVLSDALVSATNAYRVDPNPTTQAEMAKADSAFKAFWGPIYAKSQDEKEKEQGSKGKRS